MNDAATPAQARPSSPLDRARVVLAVSGGIAAYKAADLASKLVQAGSAVDVVLTRGAEAFIAPLTFQALTKRAVHTDVFEPWTAASSGHISLAAEADLLLVAPASANTVARLALGLADDLLGTVALSTEAPLLIAPAMEHGMLHHPATQGHLATLVARGATQVGPDAGRLASGARGDGRLAPVEAILGAARLVLGRGGPLAGRHVVVTAGPTREPLDPVRYLGNRSSGTMGYALAQAALDRGARVTLVTGPTALTPPWGASVVRIETAAELGNAVEDAVVNADTLIMAAAVADYRPTTRSDRKLKKGGGNTTPTLVLAQNPDIVAGIQRPGLVKVGFAAETEDLIAQAAAKLRAKGLAMIVANDAAATMDRPDSAATILRPGLPPEILPRMPKSAVASAIADRLIALPPAPGSDDV